MVYYLWPGMAMVKYIYNLNSCSHCLIKQQGLLTTVKYGLAQRSAWWALEFPFNLRCRLKSQPLYNYGLSFAVNYCGVPPNTLRTRQFAVSSRKYGYAADAVFLLPWFLHPHCPSAVLVAHPLTPPPSPLPPPLYCPIKDREYKYKKPPNAQQHPWAIHVDHALNGPTIPNLVHDRVLWLLESFLSNLDASFE